jgi:uncharacterized protein (DUF58 family)
MLKDQEFIRKLEMLSLLARKILGGKLKAERKTPKKGSGINFADYAEYYHGDDYRNIDWNIYARLEQLVVKLFEIEEDTAVFVMLDLSPSMKKKEIYAKKLAAALSYIALNGLDRLCVYGLADALSPILPMSHGRGKIFTMLDALDEAPIFGHDTSFKDAFKNFRSVHKKPGMCIIISDFFIPGGIGETLDSLLWGKNEVFCIQTLDKDELKCDLHGDVELECVETGSRKKITVSPFEAKKYEEEIRNWNIKIKSECAKRGVACLQASTDVPFEDVIQNVLRRRGLLT